MAVQNYECATWIQSDPTDELSPKMAAIQMSNGRMTAWNDTNTIPDHLKDYPCIARRATAGLDVYQTNEFVRAFRN